MHSLAPSPLHSPGLQVLLQEIQEPWSRASSAFSNVFPPLQERQSEPSGPVQCLCRKPRSASRAEGAWVFKAGRHMPPGRQTHPSWQFEWHIPQVPTALLVAFGLLPFMSALGGSHAEHWLGLGPSQASDRHVSEHAMIALMVVIFRLPAASAAAPAGLPRSTGMKAESKEDSTGSENRQAATNRSNTAADCISSSQNTIRAS